jgi:hypothetical protein
MDIDFTTILFGQSGIAAIVALVVGGLKKAWPKANKTIYMVSAIVLSIIGGAVAFPVFSITWNWLLWGGMSGAVLAFQLLEQNELWPKIKSVIMIILRAIFKPKV